MIKLSKTTQARIDTLHPDLQRVIRYAANIAEADEDFTILDGGAARTKDQMALNYGKGRTVAELIGKGIDPVRAQKYAQPKAAKVTWLNNPYASNHRVYPDGYGHAVDLIPYPIDWNAIPRFQKVIALVKRAAEVEGVKLVYGADWKQKDWPHVELA